MSARSVRPWACLGLIAAAAALAYAPSFSVPFQFDDYARIIDNEPLRSGQWRAALDWLGAARVLPSLTIVANYVGGGERVLGYHLVNFALHLLATLGVFVLARQLCRGPRLRDSAAARRPLVVAGVAALIMACHPLQTQAVTYIIQRAAVMSALFYVWAVACYVRGRLVQIGATGGRSLPWFIATAVLWGCALLSKENAASLPLALLLAELVVIGGRPSLRSLALGGAVAVLLLLIPLAWKIATWQPLAGQPVPATWLGEALAAILDQGSDTGTAPPSAYLLTQLTVIPGYLRLVVLPWGLNLDHDVPLATGWTSSAMAGLALLAALFAIGLLAARRAPLIGFGILWIFIALSVESSVLPIIDVMMEHRMYLAMPGVGLIAGAAFAGWSVRWPRVTRAAVGGIAIALVSLTFARNLVWQSPLSLWLDAAEKSPRKGRVLVNYGVSLHGAGQLMAAARQYCRAMALDPGLTLAGENLELALAQQGKLDNVAAGYQGLSLNPDSPGVFVEVDIPGRFCPELLAAEQ
ncbi:hypothetical protein KF840_26075 [bacterium]|nr:hypothetical protein [bacterium]